MDVYTYTYRGRYMEQCSRDSVMTALHFCIFAHILLFAMVEEPDGFMPKTKSEQKLNSHESLIQKIIIS